VLCSGCRRSIAPGTGSTQSLFFARPSHQGGCVGAANAECCFGMPRVLLSRSLTFPATDVSVCALTSAHAALNDSSLRPKPVPFSTLAGTKDTANLRVPGDAY
jgi:hypothetical protein